LPIRRVLLLVFILGLVSLTIILSTNNKHAPNHPAPLKENTEATNVLEEDEPSLQLVQERMYSSKVMQVPWQKDPDFLKAQKENHTPVMMAAYRTVLPDPLPGEEANVHLGASYLRGTVVKPGRFFPRTLR
jgi:vancomycin resistance protein VanW